MLSLLKKFIWASPFFTPSWQLKLPIENNMTSKANVKPAKKNATQAKEKKNKMMNSDVQ